jgi:hypothetical protein
VLEAPIAFVKRPVPVDDDGDPIQSDLREPLFFAEGGDVYLRSNSTVTATETNITFAVTAGQGDARDLKPNFDGTRLAFALRLFDENPNDDVVPSWNIFEYNLEDGSLRCIMDNDFTTLECDGLVAQLGDDIAPAYLPDGRIIFSSNRQTQSGEMLTNESKPRFRALDENENERAMYLHVWDDFAKITQQISFNQSHDLDPTVLSNNLSGHVLFTRWDNAGGNNAMHLYTMKPDGTTQQLLYGAHSHNTGKNNDGSNDATIQFTQPEEMEDGRIMVIARPYSGTFGGGSIVMIDAQNFINNDQPVFSMLGMPGTAQSNATINNVSAADELSLGGRYSAAWPLWDGSNRVLVSQSSCQILADNVRRPCIEPYLSAASVEEISPAYAIWLYDLTSDVQKVIVQAEQGTVITDIVAIQSRTNPPDVILDDSASSFNFTWSSEGIGALHIRSVYDFGSGSFNGCFLGDCTDATNVATLADLADPANATADQRPARFVRFVKPVSLPDDEDPDLQNPPDLAREAFGPQRNQDMREIVGYAPVEPDGSVKVVLPANIALAVSVLDKMGRRIGPRHQNWFQVRPGETVECGGCHTHDTQNNATPDPHGRADAEAPTINAGRPASNFPNTLEPVSGQPYLSNFGETMAEVRFNFTQNNLSSTDDPVVNVDLEYEDYWTDTVNTALTANPTFSYEYAGLDTVLRSPASAACDPWNFKCRILLNYQEHIHPMWALPRLAADGITDNTCTSCHANTSAVPATQVPAAQLNLTVANDPEDNDPRIKSYLELFIRDAGQELDVMGNLVNIQIPQQVPILDAQGNPVLDTLGNPTFDIILVDDPAAAVAPAMSGNGARSSFFITKMTSATATRNGSLAPRDAGYVDHSSFMSAHELRLIIEWLDIGAQYFNDPFDPAVPMN